MVALKKSTPPDDDQTQESVIVMLPKPGQPVIVSHFIGLKHAGTLEVHGDINPSKIAELVLIEVQCGGTMKSISQAALTSWFESRARL